MNIKIEIEIMVKVILFFLFFISDSITCSVIYGDSSISCGVRPGLSAKADSNTPI